MASRGFEREVGLHDRVDSFVLLGGFLFEEAEGFEREEALAVRLLPVGKERGDRIDIFFLSRKNEGGGFLCGGTFQERFAFFLSLLKGKKEEKRKE
jgi:hypothetical protein